MQRGEAGFSLLETVLALALCAGVLTVLAQGFAGSWGGLSRARSSALALSIARSQFALAGLRSPLSDGQSWSGHDGGVSWTLLVRLRPPARAGVDDGPPPAFWLHFDASWSSGLPVPRRSLSLRMLKLGASP